MLAEARENREFTRTRVTCTLRCPLQELHALDSSPPYSWKVPFLNANFNFSLKFSSFLLKNVTCGEIVSLRHIID